MERPQPHPRSPGQVGFRWMYPNPYPIPNKIGFKMVSFLIERPILNYPIQAWFFLGSFL